MPKIPGVSHQQAVRALRKAGCEVKREGRKHIVMSDGVRIITILRANPINAYTMGGIVETSAGAPAQRMKVGHRCNALKLIIKHGKVHKNTL